MFPRSLRVVARVIPQRGMNSFVASRQFTSGKQGFAAMDPQKQREAASKGGQASQSHTVNSKAPELNKAKPSYIINPNRGQNPQKRVTQPEKNEFKAGDLVRYSAGANTTEGLIKAVYDHPVKDEFGRIHQGSVENPMFEIENHYTKNRVFHHQAALHWLARGGDIPPVYTQEAPKAQTQTRTPSQTAQARAAAEPIHQDTPLNVDFAPGDIVRFQVGKNITAGEIEEIYFTPQHDEFNNFHNATKDAPMARIRNLWTKHPVYHHLDVIELVKTAEAPAMADALLREGKNKSKDSYFETSESTDFNRATAPPAGSTSRKTH